MSGVWRMSNTVVILYLVMPQRIWLACLDVLTLYSVVTKHTATILINPLRYVRFGEESLHSCEVMLRDIEESKRVNNAIAFELKKNNQVRMHPSYVILFFVFLCLSLIFFVSYYDSISPMKNGNKILFIVLLYLILNNDKYVFFLLIGNSI